MPTFPTQVWLLARANVSVRPITPTGNIRDDIELTKSLMARRRVLGKANTCLEPKLYRLAETGADIVYFDGKLNELAPAVLNGDSEMTILDVPDALIAMERWPGRLKILGPVSSAQTMAVALPPSSPELTRAFRDFFTKSKLDGTYLDLVQKYYPSALDYFETFFVEQGILQRLPSATRP